MSALADALEFPHATGRHSGRHVVVDAVFVSGGERIPVVVKKTRTDWRQRWKGAKGERSYRTALSLLARGLPTPEPIGFEIARDESWYVARKLDGAAQVREWFWRRDDQTRPPPAIPIPFEEIVCALGRLARSMHDKGVFFRDLTDGNVLVTQEAAAVPRLWLVDLNRARLQDRPLSAWRRLRDLSRPGLNRPEDRRLLLDSYFGLEATPWSAMFLVSALRRRVVLWDRLKRRLRPWRG